jgi:predicted GNAT family N-acyltransferase
MSIYKEKYFEILEDLKPKGATLVAVSKIRTAKEILELYNLGQKDFGENYVQTIQLRQMAVDINMQGTGIGGAIVDFAEKTAKEKGFKILMMHARDVVISFYEKCGYHIADDGFTEVGIPHHKMEKHL